MKTKNTILVVDDEVPLVKMAKQMLERQGYEVVGTTDSTNALKVFQKESDKFELVITDMEMPVMTGEKLAIELMKIRPGIPVILCTGYSKKISHETATKIGIKAITYKPIAMADLAKTVRKVLDRAKFENQG